MVADSVVPAALLAFLKGHYFMNKATKEGRHGCRLSMYRYVRPTVVSHRSAIIRPLWAAKPREFGALLKACSPSSSS